MSSLSSCYKRVYDIYDRLFELYNTGSKDVNIQAFCCFSLMWTIVVLVSVCITLMVIFNRLFNWCHFAIWPFAIVSYTPW